ncbi:MAG: hypothetical protein JXA36_05740 [Coriobacteriia bacterium]|nr:hypothetical protein [Coriobacteriia bacterium]
MDDKVLEEIKSHKEVVARDVSSPSNDVNSPLFQIREKEMEISGRVFAARNQSDKMISDARQRSLEIVRNARADADRLAKEHADKVLAEVDASITEVKEKGVAEAATLEQELAKHQSEAASFVVKLVTSV